MTVLSAVSAGLRSGAAGSARAAMAPSGILQRAGRLAGRGDFRRLAHVHDDGVARLEQRRGVFGGDPVDARAGLVSHAEACDAGRLGPVGARQAAAATPFSSKRLCSSPAWNISRMMSAPPMNSPFT